MKKVLLLQVSIILLAASSCKRAYLDPNKTSTEINGIKISTWMYQIQNLEETINIDELGEVSFA